MTKAKKLSKPIMPLPGVKVPPKQEQTTLDLSDKHIHIMIPAFGGQVTEAVMRSMFHFIMMAQATRLNWSYDTMVNDSLVTRARNNLCARAPLIAPKATHWMFIDADIRFKPENILGMIIADKDVIGGLYPKKGYPIDYNFNPVVDGTPDIDGLCIEVDTIATGFLLFKPEVYAKLCKAYPETKYIDDVGVGRGFPDGVVEANMYAIFDTVIDERGRYLSEDWTFSRRWKAEGGKCWADTRVLLNHIGSHEFSGEMKDLEMKGIKYLTPAQVEEKNAEVINKHTTEEEPQNDSSK